MIGVCFLFFKIPLLRGGPYLSIVTPTGAKHRVQSPLEGWPRTISTDRPQMESRPYEFLLQSNYGTKGTFTSVFCILLCFPRTEGQGIFILDRNTDKLVNAVIYLESRSL